MRYLASDQQRQYWLQEQLVPGNSAYNIVSVCEIEESLNPSALKQAMDAVFSSHPIFRTVYEFGEEGVYANDDACPPPTLEVIDEGNVSRDQLLKDMQTFVAQSFSLAEGPLLRARLSKTLEGQWLLGFSVHHSIIDMQTRDMLGKAISDAYNSVVESGTPKFSLNDVSYSAYASWYREWLSSADAEQERQFWREEYTRMGSGDDFPFDYGRPAIASLQGTHFPVTFSSEMSEQLVEFSRTHVTRPYLTLLTCYVALLKRYTGADMITVGVPLTNRTRPEHKDALGCFMNIVPVSVDVSSSDASFEALHQSVRAGMLSAHRHQILPFVQLVDAVNPKRDQSRSPIFQTLFTFQHPMPLSLNGARATDMAVHPGGSQLDFSMSLWESSEGVKGFFEYSTDLIGEETARRFVGHFYRMVTEVMAHPDVPLSSLELLSAPERSQILEEWNHTDCEYPPVDGLHQMFERQVEKTPDAVALEMPDSERLTYRQFNERCNQLAHYLIQNGVGRGSRVGVFFKRSIEMVVSLHAIEKAGGVYVPLEPDFPGERIIQMIDDAEIKLVLQLSSVPLRGVDAVTTVSLDIIADELSGLPKNNPDVGVTDSDDAYIIFTSGSTGRPKGVLNGHRGICNRIYWTQQTFQLTSEDVILQKTPFTFDVSVWEFFWPFMCGAKLVVSPPDAHKDPNVLCRLIRDYGVTTIHFVPSMLEVFLGSPEVEMANDSLKRIICSGEALSRPLQDRCLTRMSAGLYNLYGPTEAAVDVTYWECKKEDSKASVPIGKPVTNTQIYILDEHLNPVPIGVAGELHIGGVQVAKGYVNRPDLTEERFIPDPFCKDGTGRLYKTGDWSRFRPDGNIEYIGRMDGQVKIHGLRIELDEITVALIEEVDFIQQAVTIISHEGADARLVAYVVLEKSAALDESAIREGLLQRLPAYMIPEVYIPLEEIPLSPNGKVDRKRLPAVQAMLQKTASGQKPSTETERDVLQIWQDVLQLADVGVERNFFDVGGTSILAVRLTNKLSAEYCQTLSPMFVFSYPNIKDQARYLDSQQRESSADLVAMQDRVEKARRAARTAGRRRR